MADNKLTALGIKRLEKPGFYGDGGGLYLRIAENRKSWLFRFKRAGKTHWAGLGPVSDVSLADAREKARLCREQLRQGVNPIDARRDAKADAIKAEGETFSKVAAQYIAAHRDTWRNAKHAAQWESTLALYAYPVLGERPVSSVTTADVLAVIEPIWNVKPETASRVRGRVETVLNFAAARHLRSGENPARWKGHLEHSLPARAKVAKVQHHAAAPWQLLPEIMGKLAESKGTAALCLRFAVLTAARSGEARGVTWAEIDIKAALWTVPAERMKAGREHRVPLSGPALAILREMAQLSTAPDRLVFQGGKEAAQLSDVAVNKAMRVAGGGAFTVHGMRSSFRQWAAEQTTYPREVAEMALAHTNRDKVEAAYQRSDLFEKRARLLAEWGAYVTTPTAERGDVVSIGKARA